MKDLHQAKSEISDFLHTSYGWRFVSAETGEIFCSPQAFSWELAYGKLILSFRHDGRVLSRKILDYRLDGDEALYLKFSRSGRREVSRAVIARPGTTAGALELRERRKAYRKILKSAVLRNLAGVRHMKGHGDSASLFAKFSAELRGRPIAIIGVGTGENPSEMSRIVSAGLVWLAKLKAAGKDPKELYLFVPRESADTVARRAAWINKRRVRLSIFETARDHSLGLTFRPVRTAGSKAGAGAYAWPERGVYRTSPLLMRVIDLEPSLIRRHPSHRGFDSLRMLGLEFGRVYGKNRDAIRFGIGEEKRILNEETWPELENLVAEIIDKRRYNSPDKNHVLYRLQEERWLESLLLDNVRKLGVQLDERYLYSQVPVYLGADRGMADILTVNADGRLVVIEIKASEDMDLPLQGLDYWSAVHWHNQRGDFQKRGYFQGIKVSRQYPLLYLVAPLFRFHKTFETVVGFIRPEVEITKIAINLNWKRELKVLRSVTYRAKPQISL